MKRLFLFGTVLAGITLLLCNAFAVSRSRPFHGLPDRSRAKSNIPTVTVAVTPEPVNRFIPSLAFGAGVDGQENGEIARIFTAENIEAMRSAGLKSLSYRLRTELGMEFWHWNPRGRWSDAEHQQGYWTSESTPGQPIDVSYGYRLPRRGNTFDQANNDGYSRLDDGNTDSFWKSNPYLDQYFTGEDNALHPQWVVIDLGKRVPFDVIRILWGNPYATQFQVQYWEGDADFYTDDPNPGQWKAFPAGTIRDGRGGGELMKLSDHPIAARFVRIWMTASSGSAREGAADIRDRLGYSIYEIYLGTLDERGHLRDAIRHAPLNRKQTVTYASSTDPWHRATDRDDNTEQPGLDLVFRSGLASELPVLLPVALLFGTPENAVAEMKYLRARGYLFKQVEMGEEPDEQYITAEDYGSLYLQWADALHRADETLELGGPSFETITTEVRMWPDRPENRGWIRKFLNYLRSRDRLGDYRFLSFEWYPFDKVCLPAASQLTEAPRLLEAVLQRFESQGVPRNLPLVMAEYGYSAFPSRAEVDIEGALLNADILGAFLTLGGDSAYLYGYEPTTLLRTSDCNTWGNLALFLSDDERRIKARLPAYYASVLVTHEWAQENSEPNCLYAASTNRDDRGEVLVTSYALRRPDGQWSLLLINKDPKRSSEIRAEFVMEGSERERFFKGPVDIYQYSAQQYKWRAKGEHGHAVRNLPPAHFVQKADENTTFTLPPYSITILRGRLSQ